jgi:hypothetical protein
MRWSFCYGNPGGRKDLGTGIQLLLQCLPPLCAAALATRGIIMRRRFGQRMPVLHGATMRTIFVTAVVTAAVVVFCGVTARQADAAMPVVVPMVAAALPIETVTNVCGTNGCVRVQVQRVVKHQKAGNVVPRHN